MNQIQTGGHFDRVDEPRGDSIYPPILELEEGELYDVVNSVKEKAEFNV